GPEAPVRAEEGVEELAQFRGAVAVRRDRTQAGCEGPHLLRALDRQRAQEVFLVREVEIERAVRRARGANDVVDAGLVIAALGDPPRGGAGRLAHRFLPLRAQLARRWGGPRNRRDPAGPLARRCVRFAHAALDGRGSCPALRGSYCVRRARRVVAL